MSTLERLIDISDDTAILNQRIKKLIKSDNTLSQTPLKSLENSNVFLLGNLLRSELETRISDEEINFDLIAKELYSNLAKYIPTEKEKFQKDIDNYTRTDIEKNLLCEEKLIKGSSQDVSYDSKTAETIVVPVIYYKLNITGNSAYLKNIIAIHSVNISSDTCRGNIIILPNTTLTTHNIYKNLSVSRLTPCEAYSQALLHGLI